MNDQSILVEEWPYASRLPSIAEALTFIASLIERDPEKIGKTRKKVYDRLRHAKEQKKHPYALPSDGDKVSDEKFWMRAARNWPALQHLRGFPYRKKINVSISVGSLDASGTGYSSLPPGGDYSTLNKMYIDAQKRSNALLLENINLKKSLADCQEAMNKLRVENEDLKATRRKRSEMASENGKKGRGIPKR